MTDQNVTAETLARWHDHKAESAMNSLCCGSENWEYKAAGRLYDMHSSAAKLIRTLNGIATLHSMDY